MTCRETLGATAQHITNEINQISRNFECLGLPAAATATADHIGRFWAPLLREELSAQARSRPEAFSPIAKQAIAQLA